MLFKETARPDSKIGGRGVAVAAGLLLAGTIGFGLLTGSAPVPEVTATTFRQPPAPPSTLAPLADQGTPLEWGPIGQVGNHQVVSMVEWEDEVLLFAAQLDGSRTRGLELFHVDPHGLTSLGTVISSEYQITAVTSTPLGLVAIGQNPASGASSVWISETGRIWVSIAIPDRATTSIVQAHYVGETLLLVGQPRTRSLLDDMERTVRDRFGDVEVRLGPGQTAVLVGPLGIPYMTLTPEELGLDPRTYRFEADSGAFIYARQPNGSWISTPVDSENINLRLFTGPDGQVWSGSEWAPDVVATSSDGVAWTELRLGFGILPHGHGWIRSQSDDFTRVAFSSDGTNWADLQWPSFLMPEGLEGPTWRISPWSVGQHGFAAVVTDWPSPVSRPIPVNDPLTLDSGDFVLEVSTGQIRIKRDGVVVVTIDRRDSSVAQNVRIDHETRTVVVLDSDGSPLATFTYDELEALERMERELAGSLEIGAGPGLIFSDDGSEWVVQDLAGTVGKRLASRLDFIGDRLYLTFDRSIGGPPGAISLPDGISIWSAPLPLGP